MDKLLIELKGMIRYLVVPAMAFYIVPLFLDVTDFDKAIILLLLIIPFLCFASGTSYGLNKGRSFLYPIVVGLLYIPSIFIYYDDIASIYYIIAYTFVTLIGNLSGYRIAKLLDRGDID